MDKIINLYEDAVKIYESDELSDIDKYDILFSDRFYNQLNFNYSIFDGEYYEWMVFNVVNLYNTEAMKLNEMEMMMKEFKRLYDIEIKIQEII